MFGAAAIGKEGLPPAPNIYRETHKKYAKTNQIHAGSSDLVEWEMGGKG